MEQFGIGMKHLFVLIDKYNSDVKRGKDLLQFLLFIGYLTDLVF